VQTLIAPKKTAAFRSRRLAQADRLLSFGCCRTHEHNRPLTNFFRNNIQRREQPMLTPTKRLMVTLVWAIAPLALCAQPSVGAAGGHDYPLIRKGVFEGIWHTDRVQIIITHVNRDGSFTGDLRFDPRGRWGDVRTGITGRQLANQSITITRDDCAQTARTGAPERRGPAMVWHGDVCAVDFTSTFELRIPMSHGH
jgi:hypothetical protein